jgi:hypothetical protein
VKDGRLYHRTIVNMVTISCFPWKWKFLDFSVIIYAFKEDTAAWSAWLGLYVKFILSIHFLHSWIFMHGEVILCSLYKFSCSLSVGVLQLPVFCFLIRYGAVHLLRFFRAKAAASSSRWINFVHVVVMRLEGDTSPHYNGGSTFSQKVKPTLLSQKGKNPVDRI